MRKFFSTLCAAALVAVMPIPELTAPAAAQSTDPICMARMTTGREDGDREINVAVNGQYQSLFTSRGFREAACSGTEQQRTQFRSKMCSFAQIAPQDIEAKFRQQHGATPSELCQAAQ